MLPTLLLSLLVTTAEAIPVDVCSSGCDFDQLQAALDDPSVDVVDLQDPVATGPFVLDGRSVRIESSVNARIDCDSSGEDATIRVKSGVLVLDALQVESCALGRALKVDAGARVFASDTLVTGDGQPAALDGRGLHLGAGARFDGTDVVFSNHHAGTADGGAIYVDTGATYAATSGELTLNTAGTAGAMYVNRGVALLDAVEVSNNSGTSEASGIYLEQATLDVWGGIFETSSGSARPFIGGVGSTLSVWPGTSFEGGSTQVELVHGRHRFQGVGFTGGAISIDWTSQSSADQLDIRASSFVDGGLAVQTMGSNKESALYVGHSEFRNLVGSQKAGAIDLYRQRAELEGNVFDNTRSSCCNTQNAGAVAFQGITYNYSVHHNRFCRSSANNGGGALLWNKGGGELAFNLFFDHARSSKQIVDGKPAWSNNTVLEVGRVVEPGTRGTNTFANNLVLYTQPSVLFPAGALSPLSYNMLGPNVTGTTTEGTYNGLDTPISDPLLVTPIGSYQCDSDLRPGAGSPLIDAGTPGQKDPDGSPLDVGAFAAADGDRDGSAFGTDCNDQARNQAPGLDELCDGVDNDCDGDIDEEPVDGREWFLDVDQDGFGDPNNSEKGCTFIPGRVLNDEDCADDDPDRNPLVNEVCLDGIDNNCDGRTDDSTAVDVVVHYADLDNDSFGNPDSEQRTCIKPSFRVEEGGDCDDGDELVHPDADEVCDSIDNNCNGTIDGDLAIDPESWWRDVDGDDFGDADDAVTGCEQPAGYVSNDDDCNDGDSLVSPDGIEVCSGRSEDCDEQIDEDPADAVQFWPDTDEDGDGDPAGAERFCTQPSGYVTNADDCDDTNTNVNLRATEVCNSLDDDCDGVIDPSTSEGAQTWFVDGDGDDFGDPETGQIRCGGPGLSLDNTDCDDAVLEVHPGATEVCNGVDDDCVDGVDGPDAAGARDWFVDGDTDGFGTDTDPVRACDAPPNTADQGGDCDDSLTAVNPDATEVCNGLDDDCVNGVDGPDADDAVDWFLDSDDDGFGVDTDVVRACEVQDGRSEVSGDCDDTLTDVNPDAEELCNDRDDNCSGVADDGLEFVLLFRDDDEDGWGAGEGEVRCAAVLGLVESSSDCDDGDPDVYPVADEIWYDGVDQDCDGNDDDRDLDGFLGEEAGGEDCNDDDPLTYPGAPEGDDGTPRDCISVYQVVSLGGGCGGCSGSGGSPMALWVLALFGLARRQVRSPV